MGAYTEGATAAADGDVQRLLVAVRGVVELPYRLSQGTLDQLPAVFWNRHEALVEAFRPFEDEVSHGGR